MPATLRDVAEALIGYCRSGDTAMGLDTLYHPDAVSVEACPMGDQGPEVRGLEAIRAKHAWWEGAMEVHSATTEGPFLHGDDRFGLIFEVDATERATGKRHAMKEIGIYTVADGKIVHEAFFYGD